MKEQNPEGHWWTLTVGQMAEAKEQPLGSGVATGPLYL